MSRDVLSSYSKVPMITENALKDQLKEVEDELDKLTSQKPFNL